MFRIQPLMPAQAYKTYQIKSRTGVDTIRATCLQAGCDAHANGWITTVDERTDLGQKQANYIRRESGRGFREERLPSGLTQFKFEAGQKCFAEHQVTIKPGQYIVKGGDWRGNPRQEIKIHARPEDWVEDFQEHTDKLTTLLERG